MAGTSTGWRCARSRRGAPWSSGCARAACPRTASRRTSTPGRASTNTEAAPAWSPRAPSTSRTLPTSACIGSRRAARPSPSRPLTASATRTTSGTRVAGGSPASARITRKAASRRMPSSLWMAKPPDPARSWHQEEISTPPRGSAPTGHPWPGSSGAIRTCRGTPPSSGVPRCEATAPWASGRMWPAATASRPSSLSGRPTGPFTSSRTAPTGGISIVSRMDASRR